MMSSCLWTGFLFVYMPVHNKLVVDKELADDRSGSVQSCLHVKFCSRLKEELVQVLQHKIDCKVVLGHKVQLYV